jgi:hypothetical protein
MRIDDATWDQLFETLIWQAPSADGDPLDYYGYGRSDIDPDQQEELKARFRTFVETNATDIAAYMSHTGRDMTDVAHDYILTCNGHGAGFWDRCYCGEDTCVAGDTLSNAARADGEIELFVQDGCLELMS